MAKPDLELTRWADGETNNTTPSSGQRDTGWTPTQLAVSAYFNSLQLANHRWFVWLNTGVWEAVSLDLSGDLGVGGALTVTGDITGSGTIEADQLYFRSTQTKQLDIHGTTSFGTHAPGYEESTGAAQIVDVLIDLPLGAKIYGYSLRVYGNGTDNLTHKLVRIHTGGEIDVGAVTMTAPAASWSVVNNNFAPVTVAAGERYIIRVTAGGASQRVGWPTVDWTREAP